MREQGDESVLRGVVGRSAVAEDARAEGPHKGVEARERPLEHGAVTLASTSKVRAQLLLRPGLHALRAYGQSGQPESQQGPGQQDAEYASATDGRARAARIKSFFMMDSAAPRKGTPYPVWAGAGQSVTGRGKFRSKFSGAQHGCAGAGAPQPW